MTSQSTLSRILRANSAKWSSSVIGEVRTAVESFKGCTDGELRARADSLRETLASRGVHRESVHELTRQAVTEGFALAFEALRRTRGIELYDVQLRASLALVQGAIAEMQTGEGKTFSAAPATVTRALTGAGVHIVVPNAYLAARDHELLMPAFELLGVSSALLPEQASDAEKRSAYAADVTYGTGYEFGFDFLRDQVTLRRQANGELGSSLIAALSGAPTDEHALIQRSRAFAIVDEVDNVLIDDASSPLVLSGQTGQTAPDAIAHELACLLATTLVEGVDFRLSGTQRTIELTPGGMERIHAADVAIPVDALRRSWAEYVEQSLRARWLFRRDVHYVVDGDEVKIVDASTGRIFSDRTWSDGLHQAVEARERLRITAERVVLAQITRQRFYRLYGRLAGMTGTATGCEREFRSVYDLQIHPIPLRRPSQREVWETRLFADRLAKWEAIASEVERLHDQGRPILVGTRSIAESETLAALIEERGLSLQLLNGRQDAAEAAIVAAAGDSGAITIATNLAGRGTDIALDKRSLAAGGLHVIVAEPHESPRVDRQLIGRSARQGDPGSAQVFVAAQDELIQRAAPWLERPLRRGANSTGEIRMKLGNRLLKAQQALERAQAAQRQALLRRDLARDSILGQLL